MLRDATQRLHATFAHEWIALGNSQKKNLKTIHIYNFTMILPRVLKFQSKENDSEILGES